jgi:cytosine deaminase
MLEMAAMGLHVAQMTRQGAMRQCFDAVTSAPVRILHLEGCGLEPGCHDAFVWLLAHDAVEAIRLRATRLVVSRRGQRIAAVPAAVAALSLPGWPQQVDFSPRRR